MIRIFSIQISERLQYTAKIIFETILGVDYEIVVVDESFDQELIFKSHSPTLFYGIPTDVLHCIPNQGLLFETDIKKKDVFIREEEITKVSLSEQSIPGYSFDFDIFSSAFYLVTQYSNYYSEDFDEHGRYNELANPLFKKGLHQKPLVNIYAEHIWQKLKEIYPNLAKNQKSFDYKITFDIDSPFLFKHKGLLVSAGSLVKNTIKLNFKNLVQQVKVLLGKQDPYDVFDEIIVKVDKDKLLFFLLIERKHHHDGRFTYKSVMYRALIKSVSDRGIATGIHPSYTSYNNGEQIQYEKKQLERITNNPVKNSRMHFLKYKLPQTFEYLINAGITDDYTLCPINSPGYVNFISRPFLWFNVKTNSMTNLTIHPTMVMDRSLQKYMNLSAGKAWEEINKIIDTTKQYNGVFTVLFHNSTISETGEWKEWKDVFEKTVNYLVEINSESFIISPS